MAKVAINGFGRIGRLFFRLAFDDKDIDIVAINDLGDVENLAYLLKYDSVYGKYDKQVKVKGDSLVVGGKTIPITHIKDPKELPWKKLKIDIAVEATGVFASYEKAKAHIDAGAKKVVITAPSKDADGTERATVLVGVNDGKLESLVMSSNGSCTTNATSPVVAILVEELGIKKAMVLSVHGYTASQNLVDGPSRGSDFRRGRAAAVNIVPSSTGAATTVAKAVEEMKGKFDGIALRIPLVTGSIADITLVSKRKTSVKEVNDILTKASKSPRWKGIMTVTDEPLVSSDIVGELYGAIVDLNFTRVVDGDLVKILSWYDNELGYVSTLVRHVRNVSVLV